MASTALLAVTADQAVRVRMERVAAAAQLPLDVQPTPGRAGHWLRAPMVLLDAALAETVAATALPRRGNVMVFAGETMTSGQWRACVALGADRVVTADESDYDLVPLLTDAAGAAPAGEPGRVITVIGGCGGAGASCLAAAVALAGARADTPVLLCDLDRLGAGLHVLLGTESVRGARWADISASHGRIQPGVLRQALPSIPGSRGGAALLGFGDQSAAGDLSADRFAPADRPADRFAPDDPAAGERPSGARADPDVGVGVVDAVLDATVRDGETAVVDVPRALTAAAERAVTRAALTVLVVPADVRGCYAAARLLPSLTDLGATISLVVRGPAPGGVGPEDVGRALDLPVIAAMRPQPGLARSIDAGRGLAGLRRGPLQRAARAVLAAAGDRV